MNDRIDEEVGQAIREASGEPRADVKARALAAMRAVQPATRRPWRWAVAGAGLMALIGFGFVPVRVGEATGVLARAAAVMEGAPTIHVVARGWSRGDEYRFEEWSAADGSVRYDKWKNGGLWYTRIRCPDWTLHYHAPSAIVRASDFPPMPEVNWGTLTSLRTREGLGHILDFVEEHLDGSVEEWREDSLLRQPVDVIEAIGHVAAGAVISGIPYESAGMVCVRAEIDVATDQLLSLREYREVSGSWELAFETETIEWEIEIPESVWEFHPPAGTELHRYTWWAGRADQELAVGYAGDWKVVLHALDVNRQGDVTVTISRWLPEAAWGSDARRPGVSDVTAVDSRGVAYSQASGCSCILGPAGGYWTTEVSLEDGGDGPPPRSITLTIGSEAEARTGHEPVTFYDIALPQRQDVDDVSETVTEVIQY